MTTLTLKIQNLYVAYSPEIGTVAYGSCQDEAINGLQDEPRVIQTAGEKTR